MKQLIIFIISILILTGCVTYNKCVSKYGTQRDTVRITSVVVVHDTVRVVTLPDSLQGLVNTDSLMQMIDTLRNQSASGKLQIKFWKDKFGKLSYKVSALRDTIYWPRIDTVTVSGDCPPGVLLVKDKEVPWFRALWLKYQLFAAWALLVLLFALVFLNKIKSLFK